MLSGFFNRLPPFLKTSRGATGIPLGTLGVELTKRILVEPSRGATVISVGTLGVELTKRILVGSTRGAPGRTGAKERIRRSGYSRNVTLGTEFT